MGFQIGEAFIEFRQRGLSGVQKATQRATGALNSMAKIAGGAAVAGLAAITVRSFQTVDALAKTADKLGLTTESLAGLRHAAELTGAGTRTLDMGLQRMTRRIAQAAQGSGEAKDALRELGLDAAKLASMSPDEQFLSIARAMQGVGNQSDKVRLAFKLFDSEGVNLANTLAAGESGIREMVAEAERLGLAVSRDQAAEIEKANDAVTRMQAAFSGVGRTIAIAVAPAVEAVANTIAAMFAPVAQGGRVFGALWDVAVASAAAAIPRIHHLFLNLWDAIAAGLRSALAYVFEVVADLDERITGTINKIPGVNVSSGIGKGALGMAAALRDPNKAAADDRRFREETIRDLDRSLQQKMDAFWNAIKPPERVRPNFDAAAVAGLEADGKKNLRREQSQTLSGSALARLMQTTELNAQLEVAKKQAEHAKNNLAETKKGNDLLQKLVQKNPVAVAG